MILLLEYAMFVWFHMSSLAFTVQRMRKNTTEPTQRCVATWAQIYGKALQ